MDRISGQLTDYVTRFSTADLSEAALARAGAIVFDTIACAVAGRMSEPAAIVDRLAGATGIGGSATLFGHGKASPEIAALANGIMIRTYDYNDAYFGHPSDMIAGILAVGETVHASGKDILTAIALAYDVFGALSRSGPYHLDTWVDQGVYMNIGVALAAGMLLGMTPEQLANAQSLSLLPNLPLGACRWGTLSMMKGASTAFAVRNGVFAALLAKEGFTSSPEPYEGKCGFFDAVGPFKLKLPLLPDVRVIELPYIKPIPAENNTIGLAELAPEIRAWTPVEDIESIDIELATGLDHHVADAPKYDPKTRESADHSLPFILARALVDGGITLETYTPERIADPALRPLMRKIRVHGSDELKALMSASKGTEAKPARIVVRTAKGVFEREIMSHSGHPETSAARTWDMLDEKLNICAEHAGLPESRRERIRQAWRDFSTAKDVAEPLETLASFT